MRDILKHATRLTSMFGLALAMALIGIGCAPALPEATFEAGTDEGNIGTLDDGAGTTFEIESGDQGVARVIATDTSTGDTSSWTFDEQGRLDTITAANGSVLDIDRGDDGSATISVTDLSLETPFGPVSLGNQTFALPAGTLTAKTINQRILAGGTAVSDACALIDANCADLNTVLSELRPALIAAGIELLNDPSFAEFETAVNALGGVESVVDTLLAQYFDPLVDYCDAWERLKASAANPCS